jgi:hypothetical protein
VICEFQIPWWSRIIKLYSHRRAAYLKCSPISEVGKRSICNHYLFYLVASLADARHSCLLLPLQVKHLQAPSRSARRQEAPGLARSPLGLARRRRPSPAGRHFRLDKHSLPPQRRRQPPSALGSPLWHNEARHSASHPLRAHSALAPPVHRRLCSSLHPQRGLASGSRSRRPRQRTHSVSELRRRPLPLRPRVLWRPPASPSAKRRPHRRGCRLPPRLLTLGRHYALALRSSLHWLRLWHQHLPLPQTKKMPSTTRQQNALRWRRCPVLRGAAAAWLPSGLRHLRHAEAEAAGAPAADGVGRWALAVARRTRRSEPGG